MKPHLPLSLLISLLSTFIAHPAVAVEIPDNYSEIYLNNVTALGNYSSNSAEDNLAFLLRRKLECSPDSIETWSSSALVTGGNLLFCSNNSSSPVALSFKDGNYSAFTNQGALTFDTLSNLTFSNIKGGAIKSNSVSIRNVDDGADDTVDVLFELNQSDSNGGAVYSGAELTISSNDVVTISHNAVKGNAYAEEAKGGAIYAESALTISNNSKVAIDNNIAETEHASYGGAIYANSTLTIADNQDITFSGNIASSTNLYTTNQYPLPNVYGGAIYASDDILIHSNSNVSFIDNKLTSLIYAPYGGAIYAKTSLTISENDKVLFQGNTTTANAVMHQRSTEHSSGGAIYATTIILSDNIDVSFIDNFSSYGGAIFASNLTIKGNSVITFSGNTAFAYPYFINDEVYNRADWAEGGALYAENNLLIQDNGDITFYQNVAQSEEHSFGGAIYTDSDLTINGNGNVSFIENTSLRECDYHNGNCQGGAVYAKKAITISENKDISFVNNTIINLSGTIGALCNGGAICADDTLLIYNNQGILFCGNKTSDGKTTLGGAIYSTKSLTISENADVTFRNNSARSVDSDGSGSGGAIYAKDSIEISGNANVLFEKNYEKQATTYQLRSIYQVGGNMTFAAKTGGEIEFYDSVYSTGSAHLNGNYTDAEGKSCTATGDIIFSGKYTETHLNEILSENNEGRTAIQEEILNSQTSYIGGGISLYNGTLQVIDGAQLNGGGVAVSGQGKLLLQDAGMNHAGKAFTFNTGATLELHGVNSISANSLTLNNGTIFSVSLADNNQETALLSLTGTLSTGSLLFNLNVESEKATGMYKIISLSDASQYDTANWTADNVTVNGQGAANGASYSDLLWQDGILYYVASPMWSNHSGNNIWSSSDTNWNNGSAFRDGQEVIFTDRGAGTVYLSGDINAGNISVSNTVDYIFTASEEGGRLVGDSGIIKKGTGALTLATANEQTDNTELLEGTLNIHHSTALGATAEGKAALMTTAESTLNIDNNSEVVLAANDNNIAGKVNINKGSSLEMKSSGYVAADSTVNGTLTFSGQASSSNAGALKGNGKVEINNARVSFSNATGYSGDLSVTGRDAELKLSQGSYKGSGTLAVRDGSLTFSNRNSISLGEGGALTMENHAIVSAQSVNIMEGARLHIGAAVENNSLTNDLMKVLYNVNAAQGFNPSMAVNTVVGATLKSNGLNLFGNSTLVASNSHLDLSGAFLSLDTNESSKINLVLTLSDNSNLNSQIILFSNVGGVDMYIDDIFATSGDGIVYSVSANNYFTGSGINSSTTLNYDSINNVVYLQGFNAAVPEPATTSLSLLALTALAMRRRRNR